MAGAMFAFANMLNRRLMLSLLDAYVMRNLAGAHFRGHQYRCGLQFLTRTLSSFCRVGECADSDLILS